MIGRENKKKDFVVISGNNCKFDTNLAYGNY